MAYYKAHRNTIEFSWLARLCLECYLFLSEDWLIFLVIPVWSLLAFKSNLYMQKVFPLLFTFPFNTGWFSTIFIRPHTFPQLLYLRANTFDMDAQLQCGIAVSPRCCTIIAGIYANVQWGYFSKYCGDSISIIHENYYRWIFKYPDNLILFKTRSLRSFASSSDSKTILPLWPTIPGGQTYTAILQPLSGNTKVNESI